MTDPRRQRWDDYFRLIADLLRLKDWTIVISDEGPVTPDALAACLCIYGRKRAVIRLSDSFLDEPAESQRHAAVHELLHCHFDDAYYFAFNRMDGESEQEAYNRFVEKGIDGLADAISPMLPMPGTFETPAPLTPAHPRELLQPVNGSVADRIAFLPGPGNYPGM